MMNPPQVRAGAPASISVIGAGIAGTWQALMFAKAGCKVALYERSDPSLTQATGHWAGGMLAPYCEGETAEYLITRLGLRSLDLWRETLPQARFNGSLVVAHARDRADIVRFDRLAGPHRHVGAEELAELEPVLAGRFPDGLYFEREGHLDPRQALPTLHDTLRASGVTIEFNSAAAPDDIDGTVIDCRGIAARDDTCPRSARRQGRDHHRGNGGGRAVASDPSGASALAALYRAARRQPVSDRRDLDRGRRATASACAPRSNC